MTWELRAATLVAVYAAAVILAILKREGWGWFLFVAFMITPAMVGA